MNKNDLVSSMSKHSGLTKTDSEKALNAFMVAVEEALKTGDSIRLVGFGTFSVSNRKATEGRNPRTGEPIKIPASKLPKFRAGKALKDVINA